MTLDAARLRTAALLLHFDASWRPRLLDEGLLGLSADERALLAAIDARAFRADEERKARAAAAVVDELPVAVAIAGLPRLFSFFCHTAFVDVIDQGAALVPAVAAFLAVGPAHDAARIEGAVAQARRRRRGRGLAAGVDAAAGLGVGAVVHWSALRAGLGPDVAGSVMRGARARWELPTVGEQEGVVVDNALVDPRVAACSHELAVLLEAARSEGRAALLALAVSHGCDDEEAAGLLSELQRDGLLAGGV